MRKRFIALGTEHGAVRQTNMVPDAAKLTSQTDHAGQKIRSGNLLDLMTTGGGKTTLSPVLSRIRGCLSGDLPMSPIHKMQ